MSFVQIKTTILKMVMMILEDYVSREPSELNTHLIQPVFWFNNCNIGTWAPSQYPKKRLFVRSSKASKPRDWYFSLSYRFEIWQAHWQHCCRSACQISERLDNSKNKSRVFEALQDLTERRLFGYWDGAQFYVLISWGVLSKLPQLNNIYMYMDMYMCMYVHVYICIIY